MRKYITWIVNHPKLVIGVTGLITLGLMAQLSSLQIIIDPDSTLPQNHPYISTGNLIEKTFGNKFTVSVGISPKEGTIYQPAVLEKVARITARVQNAPGAVKANIISLSARKAKDISGNEEGMTVRPLMEKVPTDAAGLERLKKAVESNPAYSNLLVSKDQRTTQIVAEFKKLPGGFVAIDKSIRDAIAPELDPRFDIRVGGITVFLSLLEKYSQRMGFLFPLAVLIIGLIHYEAFRTAQALVLPLVTALLSVIWAMGCLGLLHEPFDVFNASTPILILAIAAGHAVQILKRFYEEYAALKKSDPGLDSRARSKAAVLGSLTKIGPVMIVACTVAALGFFSLIIFDIKSIRTFGIFTGAGVFSTLVLELTFIPALRVLLKPPGDRETARESSETFWDRVVERFYRLSMFNRKVVYAGVFAVVAILALGGAWLKVDNSQKGYFYGKIQARLDDEFLNDRMAGTNPFFLLIEGRQEDDIKRPEVLRAMDKIQTFIDGQPDVGKTISLANFIKKMNQSMNADKPEFYTIPDSRELVAQYLLLYSNSGEPGDFDTYVDYNYRQAVLTAFIKNDSTRYMTEVMNKTLAYAKEVMPKDVDVRAGGGALGGVALNEIMIHEKVLNILQIMGAVFLISSLVFRSFLAGALILVPLVAAIAVNFGIMGLLGIPLQIATSLVSAMAVGIGADYGIYMSYRMREELKKPGDEKDAIHRAFKSAGKATLFVSTAVAGGFGVLMLSIGFMIHVWMGFLIATAMLVSSITALTLFPSLIFTLRPKYIFGERTQEPMFNKTRAAVASASIALLVIFGSALAVSAARAADGPDALDIAKKSFQTSKVVDSTSTSTFRLIDSNGHERVRETKGSTKLLPGTIDNQRLVVFESPADVKGTKTLLVEHSKGDDDIWIYLPAMKKVRRLVANNKKDAFVGTDFSYGDVIGHKVEDWNHKILGEGIVDGKKCWKMESTPVKPEVADNTGYSKRTGCIDKESYIALEGEAFDQNGQLLKKFSATKIEKVDAKNSKWQPMQISAENVQTGHKTVLEFKNFKANVGVSSDLFSARTLERQ